MGRDDFGDRILARLDGAGVNLQEIERMDHPTAATVVLVAPGGSRSFLHSPGVSENVFAVPGNFGERPGHFHLANIFSLPNMRRTGAETLRRAEEAGWSTSLDTGHDTQGEWMAVLEPCLPHIGILFANEAEARNISGSADLRAAARVLLDRGAGTVVVKRGGDGCAVFFGAEELWIPGFAVHAVDTTGAGDCFTGGFLAGLYRGASEAESARLANACGALSASRMGSVSGLLNYADTRAWASNHSTKGT